MKNMSLCVFLSLTSADIFTYHTIHLSRLLFKNLSTYDVYCMASNTDKYDPEAFMIYNKIYASFVIRD